MADDDPTILPPNVQWHKVHALAIRWRTASLEEVPSDAVLARLTWGFGYDALIGVLDELVSGGITVTLDLYARVLLARAKGGFAVAIEEAERRAARVIRERTA